MAERAAQLFFSWALSGEMPTTHYILEINDYVDVVGNRKPFQILEPNEDGTFKASGSVFSAVEAMSKLFNFRYRIYSPEDNQFGSATGPNKTHWNGMIGMILNKVWLMTLTTVLAIAPILCALTFLQNLFLKNVQCSEKKYSLFDYSWFAFGSICRQDYVYFRETLVLENLRRKYYKLTSSCDLNIVGEQFLKRDFSFAFPKNSSYKKTLDTFVKRGREAGFIGHMIQTDSSSDPCSILIKSSALTAKTLDVYDLLLLFVGQISGLTIASITVIVEKVWKQVKCKNKVRTIPEKFEGSKSNEKQF
ncbi:hypothetical protein GQR58_013621 [Nymphon striatum]|nr:hypothetical protein GQR58_013621 [Nymphon striatum]